jgi:hypothetical protein
MSIPIEEYEKGFKKWIDWLKMCIRIEEENFEGQCKLK